MCLTRARSSRKIDRISIRVVEPTAPNRLIVAGTVVRQDAIAARSYASTLMRLKMMGVRTATINGADLEPLD